jgi:hypothetical protein
MKRILAAGCVVLHQLHPSAALGCGSTPDMLSPFLPAVDATGVPLDAVLFAASNHSAAITFELRRETPDAVDNATVAQSDAGIGTGGEADGSAAPLRDEVSDVPNTSDATSGRHDLGAGGTAQVPLDIKCYPASGGNLCVARPTTLLDPGARYSWQTWTSINADVGLATPPRGFTTGVGLADVGLSQVSVEVDGYDVFTSHPCGQTSSVDMTVAATGLTTPLVVNVKGVTPSYVHEPLVLTVDAPEQPFGLSSPPECFVIETFDVTGARSEVGEICPEAELPATPDGAPAGTTPAAPVEPASSGAGPSQPETEVPPVDSASSPPNEVERRTAPPNSASGCAVVRGGVGRSVPAGAWLVALALVVARRRSQRRSQRRE